MDFFVFRLSDRTTRALQGVVVIFDANPQQVWRRLATDEHAIQIPHTVARNEVAPLREELQALMPETRLDEGTSLVRLNILNDAQVAGNHLATFVARDTFTMFAPLEDSFRQRVDGWYQRIAREGA